MEKKKIMYGSEEAAQLKTVTGWISSDGRFFGKDEHMARYAGSTHDMCVCGNEKELYYTICSTCRQKSARERFLALPYQEYNGEPVYSDHYDKWFFTVDDIEIFLDEEIEDEHERYGPLDLLVGKPIAYRTLHYDFFQEYLAEDQELPDDIVTKIDEFNKWMESQQTHTFKATKIRTSYQREGEQD